MKKILVIFCFLTVFYACSSIQEDKGSVLQGYWAFLDRYGNYNEALFDEHSYATVNRFVMEPPRFRYMVKNDSLWTNNDRRKEGMAPIAKLTWLDNNHVVFNTEFVSDTLERVTNASITLANTDPKGDSSVFWPAFYDRYEQYLIKRGIITQEEAKAFRENQVIPKDIKESDQ